MKDDNLDPIRQLLRDRAREARLSLVDLSRHLGKNATYMHQYMKRKHPAVLPEDVRHSLAALLELPEASLKPPSPGRPSPVTPMAPPVLRPLSSLAQPREMAPGRDVPIFADTAEIDIGLAQEWAYRPPALITARSAFALWISGARGRLRPGDLAFVRPTQPPRLGDAVVALKDKAVVALGDLVSLDGKDAKIQESEEKVVKVDRATHQILKIAAINTA